MTVASDFQGVPSAADAAFGTGLLGQTRRLGAYARKLTSTAADADDLLQDTLLRCWSARSSFDPTTNMAAWSHTVMRNSFLTERRRARFQADLPQEAFDRISAPATQEQALELVDVENAMDELTPEYRHALALARDGLTVVEAAAELRIPQGTYKSRVSRGRRLLLDVVSKRAPPATKPAKVRRDSTPPKRRRDWTGVVIG